MDEGAVSRRMPRTRSVDRIDYLCGLARGRRVIHVGFAGETRATIDRLEGRDTWLHGRLSTVAEAVVGIDLDEQGVDRARAAGYEAFAVDAADRDALSALRIEPADVVVLGEVIEHVERPGSLLDAMHALVAPNGLLAVTTPNAASMLNPLAAVGRIELINPDHVAFYSWYTLTNLMQRHGWHIREVVTYRFPLAGEAWREGGVAAVGRALARVQSVVARAWPYVDFGLIAVASAGEARVG
jgi:SAM-dependent methyltransferase